MSLFKVYPRVGGGTIDGGFGVAARWGLSPRGRGNPYLRHIGGGALLRWMINYT